MAKRPHRRHAVRYEQAMVPVAPMSAAPGGSWIARQFNVGNMVVLASVVSGGFWFYFNTTSTLSQLVLADKVNTDAREKVRADFALNAVKTAEGIAALNTETKVQSVQLVAIEKTLDKISRTLETVSIGKR